VKTLLVVRSVTVADEIEVSLLREDNLGDGSVGVGMDGFVDDDCDGCNSVCTDCSYSHRLLLSPKPKGMMGRGRG
jgi:hypothetical protein